MDGYRASDRGAVLKDTPVNDSICPARDREIALREYIREGELYLCRGCDRSLLASEVWKIEPLTGGGAYKYCLACSALHLDENHPLEAQ